MLQTLEIESNKERETNKIRQQTKTKQENKDKKAIFYLPLAIYLLNIAQALTSLRYLSPDLFSAALKSVTSNQKSKEDNKDLLSLELL